MVQVVLDCFQLIKLAWRVRFLKFWKLPTLFRFFWVVPGCLRFVTLLRSLTSFHPLMLSSVVLWLFEIVSGCSNLL